MERCEELHGLLTSKKALVFVVRACSFEEHSLFCTCIAVIFWLSDFKIMCFSVSVADN